jgi:hypothetical protein
VSRRSSATPGQVDVAATIGEDWRLQRMRGLVESSDMAGEWDPERLVYVPGLGGRLTGRERCLAPDCRLGRHAAGLLCRSHGSSCSDRGFPASRSGWPRTGPAPSGGVACLGPAR